ncbi:MAG: hypothetical protein AAF702_29355 [Chloroflexota bacterium]
MARSLFSSVHLEPIAQSESTSVSGSTTSLPGTRPPGIERSAFANGGINIFIAFNLCLLMLAAFILTSNAFLQWFVLPIFACGVLVGTDAIDWFRKRLDIYDPVGFLGLYGLYFFFLAPFLHVHWDLWTLFKVTSPQDWRNWLGLMAFLNLVGLVLYLSSRCWIGAISAARTRRIKWQLNRLRFTVVMGGALLISGMLLVRLFASFGGLAGYIEASKNPANWDGLGYTVALAESFPILAFMTVIVLWGDKKIFRSWPSLMVTLLLFIAITVVCRGLRGNRSDIIWPLFWIIGIVHFYVRPLSRKWIYLSLPIFLLFMYAYQFFDYYGISGLPNIVNDDAHAELAERTGYSFRTVVLGDLGRSDVQAFLLHRLAQTDNDYEYAWGDTYVGGVSRLIPRSIMERPPGKVQRGTEAQYGWGKYVPDSLSSSKVYGLAGETMLNFGPLGVPVAFIILGIVVGSTRHLLITLPVKDSRRLLAPFLVNLCLVVLIADLDNIIWFIAKDGGLPILVVALSSSISIVSASDKPLQRTNLDDNGIAEEL